MRKLALDLSVAQILPEKINKIFLPKKLGFIDLLSTVVLRYIERQRDNFDKILAILSNKKTWKT